jgi:hypothetical protein
MRRRVIFGLHLVAHVSLMPKGPPNLQLDRRLAKFAWLTWVIVWGVVSLLVGLHHDARNESIVYAASAQDWLGRRNLYAQNIGFNGQMGTEGFLYLPQSAILYTPFAVAGHPAGDIAWRAIGLALYATGIWRMARNFSTERALIVFTAATALAMPPALGALRNGQANLHIAGLMLHAAAELRRQRWGWAAFWLILGLAIKPIMLVMILLAAAAYRPLIWRLALGVGLLFLAPLSLANSHYVLSQYQTCWQVLKISSQPDRPFCNLQGLTWKLGLPLGHSQTLFQFLQLLTALATLWLCLHAARRWGEPMRAYIVLALAVCYLTLMNPRTEASSYVMLAPAIAVPAALLLLTLDRFAAGWAMVVLCVLLTCDGWAYRWTEYWLKPVVCCIFLLVLIGTVFQSPRTADQA